MPQAKSNSQPVDTEAAGHASRAEPAAAQTNKAGEQGQAGFNLGGRLDQFGTILAKGLDLAEAGVSLGVTILGRVGAAAQQQLRERAESAVAPDLRPDASASARAQQAGNWPAASGAPTPQAPQDPGYCITNRLPLLPGGPVQISFSINNDSMTEPKKVEARVEGFTGEAHGATISADLFKVKPAQKTIAPVDFEKFFLNGKVPPDAPPDVYRGWVVIASDTELRIPVLLVATPL
jgi:hypothetical protein